MSPRDVPVTELLQDAAPRPRPRPSILLLVAMTGIGPFTMQIIVPCLPAMAVALATSYGTIQLTLTLYLVGVAAGQLLYGPLSDRYGRKPLLIGGLILHILGSLGAALAPGEVSLIAARVAQALGSCAGLVLGRAMVRDVYPREQAASVIGYVSMAMAVAPMLAPLLGSLLAEHFGWRATMVACLLAGLPLLLALRWRLPETLPQRVPLPGITGMLGAYATLLRLPAFRAYCGITAFSSMVFFAFMAGGPLVVVQGMGYPPTVYAAAMMAVSVAWSLGSFIAARLAQQLGVQRMLRLGTGTTTAGGALAVAFALTLPPQLLTFFLPMVLVAIGNGMTQPNAIAAAVSVRPALAGTASGLVGALQMGFGAMATLLCGFTEAGDAVATAFWMLAGALGTQFCLAVARRNDA